MSKLLTLHRPTAISKLIADEFEHPDSQPEENIPQWTELVPFAKFPNCRCPGHNKFLSRGPLAEPIGQFPRNHGFDVQDPLLTNALGDYHPLHDKHMRNYWTDAMKKNMKHRGLIDDKGRVACTIHEFKKYHNFLYVQFTQSLQKRLSQMDTDRKNQHDWQNAQNYLGAQQDYNETLLIRSKRAENIFQEKLNRWKKAVENYQQRSDKIALCQSSKKRQGISEGHRRDLLHNRRHQDLLALRKKETLILKRKLREQDAALQQRILTNKRRELEITSTKRQERFHMHRLAFMRERNEAKLILEKFLTEMQIKVLEREERYRQQHSKLDEDLVRRKTGNLVKKYERRSKKALVCALLKECQKGIRKSSSDNAVSVVDKTTESAISAAYAIHTTISHTTSSTVIIDTASQFIFDLQESPGEPLPLDKQTISYVMGRLDEIMEQILQETVRQALALITQVALRQSDRVDKAQRLLQESLSNEGTGTTPLTSSSARSGQVRSKVSLGPVTIFEQYETDSILFKKCKNRPPTPVTSVTSLVECTRAQSAGELSSMSKFEVSPDTALELVRRIQSDDYPLIHIMYSQRRYLESNLLKYRMIVEPYVEQRVLAAIDLERLEVQTKRSSGVDKDELLRRAASELLKFPDSGLYYANTLLDSVNYLSAQAIRKINKILIA